MGNGFLDVLANGWNRYWHPDITPGPHEKPTFGTNVGFSGGRKERVMIASNDQLQSAKVPLAKRDYCAHLYLELLGCRKDVAPIYIRCKHKMHAYLNCQYDDFLMRMKEYERERRLRVRQKQCKNAE